MATLTGTQSNFLDYLKDLIALEYDAYEAYQMAIDKIESKLYKDKLTEFQIDHDRHIKDLSQILANYNDGSVKAPDIKQWLAKMMISIGNLLTSDRGILRVMSYIESDTNTAYARYTNYEGIEESVTKTLQQNLMDEKKHKQWIEHTLVSLK